MTTRFRSAFYGSSGFVAARSAARIVDVARPEPQPLAAGIGGAVPQRVPAEPLKLSDTLAA